MSLDIALWAEGKKKALEEAERRAEAAKKREARMKEKLEQGKNAAIEWWKSSQGQAAVRFVESVVFKATMRLAEELHPHDFLWEENIVDLVEREQQAAIDRGDMKPEQKYKPRSIQRALRKVMEKSRKGLLGPVRIYRADNKSIVVTTHE